jgi:Fe-S cluster assembly scaffold protein SufB
MPTIYNYNLYSNDSILGVVFCNFQIKELKTNQKILIPKEVSKACFIFLAKINNGSQNIIDWSITTKPNQELQLINIFFDQKKSALALTQNIDVHHPNSVVSQTTLAIQSHESELNVHQKITVDSEADNSQITQYLKVIKLNNNAKSNLQPILKINSPTSSIKHGVATSSWNLDQKNLLKSRGLNTEQIDRILTRAFILDNLRELELCYLDIILTELKL